MCKHESTLHGTPLCPGPGRGLEDEIIKQFKRGKRLRELLEDDELADALARSAVVGAHITMRSTKWQVELDTINIYRSALLKKVKETDDGHG